MYKLQGIKLYYSAKERKTPIYITSKVNDTQISHNYNTRNILNTFKRLAQTKIQEQALSCKLDKTWNTLPINIKNSCNQKSKPSFVKNVKKYFLSTYPVSCNKRNCYSCNK